MAREDGRCTERQKWRRIDGGRVGDRARAETLPSAMMTGRSKHGGIQKCYVWPGKTTLAIEFS